jgi:hypothetical protein
MVGWFKKKPSESEHPDGEPPISYDDLKALFEYLDRPNPPACDHSHKECLEFLNGRKLPVDATLAWLKANGGFCDCEVIFNVTNEWGEKVGFNPETEE